MLDKIFLKTVFKFLAELESNKRSSPSTRNEAANPCWWLDGSLMTLRDNGA